MGCTDDIAETYFALAQQSPLGWSNEIDIRPFQEWEMEVGVQHLQELNFLPNFCKTKKEPLPSLKFNRDPWRIVLDSPFKFSILSTRIS